MAENYLLVRCPHCSALVWMDTLSEIGRVSKYWFPKAYLKPHERWSKVVDQSFPDAQDGFEPTGAEFRDYITQGQCPDSRETDVRLQLWKCGNHDRRSPRKTRDPLDRQEIERTLRVLDRFPPGTPGRIIERALDEPDPPEAPEIENLLVLLDRFTADTPLHRLVRAEIYRELGEFAATEKLLIQGDMSRYAPSAALILKAAQEGYAPVIETPDSCSATQFMSW